MRLQVDALSCKRKSIGQRSAKKIAGKPASTRRVSNINSLWFLWSLYHKVLLIILPCHLPSMHFGTFTDGKFLKN